MHWRGRLETIQRRERAEENNRRHDNGQDIGDEMLRNSVVRRGVIMSELKLEDDALTL